MGDLYLHSAYMLPVFDSPECRRDDDERGGFDDRLDVDSVVQSSSAVRLRAGAVGNVDRAGPT